MAKSKFPDNKSEVIILRVEPTLKEQLQKMADMDDRSLADYVRVQLKKMIEQMNSQNKKK
jgi:predicted HicB family RNase H-like nuclease